MRLNKRCKVARSAHLQLLLFHGFLGVCSEVDLVQKPSHPRLRSKWFGSAAIEANLSASRHLESVYILRLGTLTKGPLVLSREELVVGSVTLIGLIPQNIRDHMMPCVSGALARLAVVPQSNIFLTISVSSDEATAKDVVKFDFTLLPLYAYGLVTAGAIYESSKHGDPLEFQVVMTQEMMGIHALNAFYVLGVQWDLEMPRPVTTVQQVWRPPDYGKETLVSPVVPSTRQPPTKAPVTRAPDICLQVLSACDCAARGICAWVDGRTCIGYQGGGVSCQPDGCPGQARCKDDGCTEILDPCACAGSSFGCRWNEGGKFCQSGAGVSCQACPAQYKCLELVPRISGYVPPSGGYINPASPRHVKVIFDRPVRFIQGSRASAGFRCRGNVALLRVAQSCMELSDNTLTLDVTGVMAVAAPLSTNNAKNCNLLLDEGLVSNNDGVRFGGQDGEEYTIRLGDTIPPQVATISPKNGHEHVEPSSAILTFTFSEPIVLGPTAKYFTAKLSRLEDDESLTAVAEVELEPPRVNVENQMLKVDLSGIVQSGLYYTLSLPSGAITDLTLNAYAGMSPLVYAFKTLAVVAQKDGEEEGLSMSTVINISSAIGSVLFVTIFLIWCYSRCQRKSLRQQLDVDEPSELSQSTHSRKSSLPSVSPEGFDSPGIDAPDDSIGPCKSEPHSPQPFSPLRISSKSEPNSPLYTSPKSAPSSPLRNSLRRSEHWETGSPKLHGSIFSADSPEDRSRSARKRQQQSDIKRRWQQAFDKALEKERGPSSPKSNASRSSVTTAPGDAAAPVSPPQVDSFKMAAGQSRSGPRTAADASQDMGFEPGQQPAESAADDVADSEPEDTNKPHSGEPTSPINVTGFFAAARKAGHDAGQAGNTEDRFNPPEPSFPQRSGASRKKAPTLESRRPPDIDTGQKTGGPSHAKSPWEWDCFAEPASPSAESPSPSSPGANAKKSHPHQHTSSPGGQATSSGQWTPEQPSPGTSKSQAHQNASSPSSHAKKSRPHQGPSSPSGQAPSSGPWTSEPTSPGTKASKSQAQQNPSSPSGHKKSDGPVGSEPTSPCGPESSNDAELQMRLREVEKRMRDLMDSPAAERKKVMRELVLEHHPDKNSDPYAKDMFQFINASKGWFLCEPLSPK